ncbi:hypothetical protein J2S40_004335 [Nocardioides luteus]|uniref:Membrane fusion protein biotin-lipoyl like domain-containing protein n=1 Tax=Nocardioides luteus TaxID=1844 RepID=A0ABQ5SQB4_9ACTN|nr:hypothetical protein [Nocardioides luteus]MDR7313277.1 hypothetical protein [Nocardioides luteus]GGR42850.1 hypothetical protein GCM10010197_05200 [Nocardioides luteus]GLJ66342.1 hypothetical protein GCM10017579_03780 [Nocardioides luteus]
MHSDKPRPLTLAVVAMKVCALTALAGFCVVAISTPSEPQSLAKREQPELAVMLEQHNCVAPPTIAPWRRESAIIRSPLGELKHVTLEVGQLVEQGKARGDLVAFCADPVSPDPSPKPSSKPKP